jgi:hypothetical protein
VAAVLTDTHDDAGVLDAAIRVKKLCADGSLIGPMWQAHLAVIAIAMPFVALWAIGDAPRRCLPAIMPAGVITYFFQACVCAPARFALYLLARTTHHS